MSDWTGTQGTRFVERAAHRHWLMGEALTLINFFQRSAFNPQGGFFTLDTIGKPVTAQPDGRGTIRQLHDTTRMVHCFAIAHLLGIPDADRFVDHGLQFIDERHRDPDHGGFFWSVDDEQAVDSRKQAYGHAFVLLASSSAHMAGHPMAAGLLDNITTVLLKRFWDDAAGATSEEYGADWSTIGAYRGQNSNMHLTEALMAAFEATADRQYLQMAEGIATLIIDRHARAEQWRVAEHFDEHWTIDRHYAGDPMFRPAGTTPGHALEWSRLLIQLWETGERKHPWLREAAQALFKTTVESAWDERMGGFYYTLDWADQPDQSNRFWWPCAEGIGAAAVLAETSDGDPCYELWYRRIWGFVSRHFMDHQHGGWYPELDAALQPTQQIFTGKPDLYHALQACLIPLFPASASIAQSLANRGLQLDP